MAKARISQQQPGVEVFAIGSTVHIRKDIEATIVAITLMASGVRYQCVWWEGRTRKCEWVEGLEVASYPDTGRLRVGFRTPGE